VSPTCSNPAAEQDCICCSPAAVRSRKARTRRRSAHACPVCLSLEVQHLPDGARAQCTPAGRPASSSVQMRRYHRSPTRCRYTVLPMPTRRHADLALAASYPPACPLSRHAVIPPSSCSLSLSPSWHPLAATHLSRRRARCLMLPPRTRTVWMRFGPMRVLEAWRAISNWRFSARRNERGSGHVSGGRSRRWDILDTG
jgi:hypothetical protein